MATLRFEYFSDNLTANTLTSFDLPLRNWRIDRISRRVRYSFLLGGADSVSFATALRIELRWPFLTAAEGNALHTALEAIRSGIEVRIRIFGTGHDSRFRFPHLDAQGDQLPAAQRGLPVDIETDEVPLSAGEGQPFEEAEVVFITKPALPLL